MCSVLLLVYSCPPLWGGWPRRGRVRCGTALLLLPRFGEFVPRTSLIRPCRAARVGAPSPKGKARLSINPFCTKCLGSPLGGKRSAVAVVNDSPVGCQSRDRAARRRLSCASMTERVYRIFAKQIFDISGFSKKIQRPLRPADAGHLSHRERQEPFSTRYGPEAEASGP